MEHKDDPKSQSKQTEAQGAQGSKAAGRASGGTSASKTPDLGDGGSGAAGGETETSHKNLVDALREGARRSGGGSFADKDYDEEPDDDDDDEESGDETAGGRKRIKIASDRYAFQLPDSFFDDLEITGQTGQRLTPVRPVIVDDLDPIVDEALRALRRKLQDNAGADPAETEDALASNFFGEVEDVAERINRRELPRVTRLLLSQRGVYHYTIAEAIAKGIGALETSQTNGKQYRRPQSSSSRSSSTK